MEKTVTLKQASKNLKEKSVRRDSSTGSGTFYTQPNFMTCLTFYVSHFYLNLSYSFCDLGHFVVY